MIRLKALKKLTAILFTSVFTINLISFYNGRNAENSSIEAKSIPEIQEERKQNQNEIDAINNKLKQLEADKAEQKEYQKNLNDKIVLIQNNITLINTELDQLNKDIDDANANIDNLNNEIVDQQIAVDDNIKLFKERLCAMYVTGNDNLALAVLGSADFYEMLSRVEMLNSIAAHDEELVNTLRDDISSLEASKGTLEKEMQALKMKQFEFNTKIEEQQKSKNELDEAMKKSEDELNRIALEEKSNKDSKEELEKKNALLDKQEEDVRDQMRLAAEKLAQQQQQAQNNNNNNNNNGGSSKPSYVDSSVGASGFAIPTPGFYWISSYFGPRWGRNHNGIDIAGAGISGAAVVASKSGTVTTVVNVCSHNYPKSGSCCGNGYGNYVIIAHDGGYATLYGHLASISVSPGDHVSQGQVIGTVGSTGWSTGYHLHFEVWAGGSPQNPLNYVSY